jgi:hypothetical protein
MAKDHGSSVKNDKQYEGLRTEAMSAGNRSQKAAAGRKGGKESS